MPSPRAATPLPLAAAAPLTPTVAGIKASGEAFGDKNDDAVVGDPNAAPVADTLPMLALLTWLALLALLVVRVLRVLPLLLSLLPSAGRGMYLHIIAGWVKGGVSYLASPSINPRNPKPSLPIQQQHRMNDTWYSYIWMRGTENFRGSNLALPGIPYRIKGQNGARDRAPYTRYQLT